ncbi:MAG TPA: HEAT repeat domain-containing protein, partial [Nitrospirota bacterium]
LGKVYRGSSGDEGLRLLAVESLGGRGEFALPYLEEALKDPSDDIRVAAVKSIGTLDNSKAKLDALASAMDDREPVVTHAALTALAGAGSTAGASRMFAALGKVGLSDEAFALIRKMMTPDLFSGASPAGVAGIIDPSARKDAVTLLVDGGCPVDVLMPFLADRSVAVRLEAVRGLSQRSGVDASYGLLLAGADTSADVRAAAGAGLDGRGTDELSNAVELLFGRGMASPDVLRSAAGVLHDVVLLHRLLDGVHKDDTGRLLSVLQPLAERLNAYDVPVLLDGLKAEDHGIRSMIVKSLAKMLPPAGSDALAEAYTRYPSMKGTIIDISAGSVNAGTVLSTALSDSDPVVKLRAAARIKDLSAGPGEKLAISAFKDPDEKVRAEAVRAAGERGYAAIISEAANDPSAYVREGLVKALGGRRKPEDADVLAGLTRDKDGKVSRSALDVLVSEGEGVPAGVWAGLAEPGNSKAVRLAALGEITERKDNAGMELFAASLSDPDKDISGACMAGLAAAGKDAVPVVRGLLSEGKAVRKALDIVVMSSDPSYEPDVVSLTGKSVGEELTAAIRALGEVGGPYGLAALVKAYPGLGTSDKVTALKSVAEMRLTGGEPGLDALLSGALSSPEDDIRFYAARAAGYKSVPALRDKLVEAAGKESSQFVKREIARALDRLEKGGRDTK